VSMGAGFSVGEGADIELRKLMCGGGGR